MSIVISTQRRLARLQAQSAAAKATADESKSASEIAFVLMAEQGAIDDVTATEHISAFAPWQSGVKVQAGALRTYGDGENAKLYRCLQPHTTLEGWEPDRAPSLWKVAGDPTEEWPEWSRPIGAMDAYDEGAKVSHNGKRWISDIPDNVWEPGVYGWTEATDDD